MLRHPLPLALLILLTVAGCAQRQLDPEPRIVTVPGVGRFSTAKPGDVLPSGWQLWTLSSFKKATQYKLVSESGKTVIKATARGSASGMTYRVRIDLKEYPYLHWRWKVPQLIQGADNTKRNKEDSPVRVVVAFSGDLNKLSLEDRMFADQFKLFTRNEMPYATLMYIWENRAPRGTVIPNQYTGRIKMIVADSGPKRLNEWRDQTRNVYDDYRTAFGEDPPEVESIAIMTDTDNTGEEVDAYYGDIAFLTRLPPPPEEPELQGTVPEL